MYLPRVHNRHLFRWLAAVRSKLLHRMDHHIPLQYGPKHNIFVVQPPCLDRVDKELAAIRVLLAMVRHRQEQSLVVLHLERLVLEMATVYGFTASPIPVRYVPTLDQKVGYCLGFI